MDEDDVIVQKKLEEQIRQQQQLLKKLEQQLLQQEKQRKLNDRINTSFVESLPHIKTKSKNNEEDASTPQLKKRQKARRLMLLNQ